MFDFFFNFSPELSDSDFENNYGDIPHFSLETIAKAIIVKIKLLGIRSFVKV